MSRASHQASEEPAVAGIYLEENIEESEFEPSLEDIMAQICLAGNESEIAILQAMMEDLEQLSEIKGFLELFWKEFWPFCLITLFCILGTVGGTVELIRTESAGTYSENPYIQVVIGLAASSILLSGILWQLANDEILMGIEVEKEKKKRRDLESQLHGQVVVLEEAHPKLASHDFNPGDIISTYKKVQSTIKQKNDDIVLRLGIPKREVDTTEVIADALARAARRKPKTHL